MPEDSQAAAGRLIVTHALPYANGPIHLGHLLESIQADIWVRFQRMSGREVRFVCADDAHGTAIMLKAEELGLSPEELVASALPAHERDLRAFGVSYDNYHSTHSDENLALCTQIYRNLERAGALGEHEAEQLYDEQRQLFLADRMVTGDCPKCGAPGQYGDLCEICGATYNAVQLKNPVSSLTGATPVVRRASNITLKLALFEDRLRDWLDNAGIQSSVRAKLEEWLKDGLKDWTITRPAPYFGFQVPDRPDRFFYVWLDAPVGYMASLQNLLNRQGEELADWWNEDSEICHFIGKDIIYFHTLFWPAMLMGAGYACPSSVHVHGFLTLKGAKLSKSRGTPMEASQYLKHLPPDPLRYYLAARLNAGVEDMDFDLNDFVLRVNSDLVGKFVNLASRTARFLERGFAGKLGTPDAASPLAEVLAAGPEIAELYQKREYATAVRRIMELADLGNRYVHNTQPWELARANPEDPALAACCSAALAIFRALTIYLKPCVPQLAADCEALLGGADLCWADLRADVAGLQLRPFEPLMQRLKQETVDLLVAPG